MNNPIVIYLSCLGISIALTPVVSRMALILGAVDRPNHRKMHHIHMPTLGGLAIFGAFYVCLLTHLRRRRWFPSKLGTRSAI